MSIKELFEKLFGEIAKLFTAKNGVKNFIILIIGFFIVSAIFDYVREWNQCRKIEEYFSGLANISCESFYESVNHSEEKIKELLEDYEEIKDELDDYEELYEGLGDDEEVYEEYNLKKEFQTN
jgi:hypothetical protein